MRFSARDYLLIVAGSERNERDMKDSHEGGEFHYFAVYHSDEGSDWSVLMSREEAERVAADWVVSDWAQALFRSAKFLEIYVCQVPSDLIPDDDARNQYDADEWSLWDYDQATLESFGDVTVHANWINVGNSGGRALTDR